MKNALAWVDKVAALCEPARVHFCDGTASEAEELSREMIKKGTLFPLCRPNSFLARSSPEDVARSEESTFICSQKKIEAGPTNNWKDPQEMRDHLQALFKGCMRGRVLYVISYCMGPVGSPLSRKGIEITDSPYVALSMRIMARSGKKIFEEIQESDENFIPGLHSVGRPLEPGETDTAWPCNPAKRVIAHFPETREIFSFGSGYGGNALLGKKSFALRLASAMARDEGWMAEHMLILGLTHPNGKKIYIAAAFPSACGKTNLAMLTPTLPGWKVETVGDDIAWMRYGPDGRLFAINPEAGFFGVAPGTSWKSNPSAMASLERNTIFTNTALTSTQDVWWEGMTPTPPLPLIDWRGRNWTPGHEKAAHPNARFTVAARQCPVIDAKWEDPAGVPISAIIFGGRRSSLIPLITESFDWGHGVFFGASLTSEMTAAAVGTVGKLRHDPFAMLPFCGYNMGDYFSHWLDMGKKGRAAPKIFRVNWFLKNSEGAFLWPGFGENGRILKWIFERCDGTVGADKTPLGLMPKLSDLDVSGLRLSQEDLKALFKIDTHGWLQEIQECKKYFELFGDRLPPQIAEELDKLAKNLYYEPLYPTDQTP